MHLGANLEAPHGYHMVNMTIDLYSRSMILHNKRSVFHPQRNYDHTEISGALENDLRSVMPCPCLYLPQKHRGYGGRPTFFGRGQVGGELEVPVDTRNVEGNLRGNPTPS